MNIEFALPVGTILKSKQLSYQVVEVLGAGGFGITYKVRSTIMVNNVPITTFFAIKEHFMRGCYRGEDKCSVMCVPTMKKEVDESRNDFIVEAKRLNKLSGLSMNIVRVNEVFEYFGTAYYVMQYLDGGELASHVTCDGAMSEAKALSIIRPIAEAVKLIHAEHLLHLDIKPDNIVLMTSPADGTQYPVLIDFGIAKHFSSTGKPTSLHIAKGASDGYAPMEQYSSIDEFSPQLDVYALGATLLFLLTGQQPRKAFDIRTNDILDVLPPGVSKRTRNAITSAMQPMKENRPKSIQAFLDLLEEQYSLPLGYILPSPSCKFRIVGVEQENPSYIVYRALVTEDEKPMQNANPSAAAPVIEDDNEITVVDNQPPVYQQQGTVEDSEYNATRAMNQGQQQGQWVIEDSEYNSTKVLAPSSNSPQQQALTQQAKQKRGQMVSQQDVAAFYIYELFDRNSFKRNEDGTVAGAPNRRAEADFEQMKTFVKPNMWSAVTPAGIPMAESFIMNGTKYFTCSMYGKSQTSKKIKPVEKNGKSNTGKIIAIIAASLVLAAGLFFGGKYLYDNVINKPGTPAVKAEASIDNAIKAKDINALKKFADLDSLKAILPLAKAYLEKGDTANARKYVNLAFDGKHELDMAEAERIQAAIDNYMAEEEEPQKTITPTASALLNTDSAKTEPQTPQPANNPETATAQSSRSGHSSRHNSQSAQSSRQNSAQQATSGRQQSRTQAPSSRTPSRTSSSVTPSRTSSSVTPSRTSSSVTPSRTSSSVTPSRTSSTGRGNDTNRSSRTSSTSSTGYSSGGSGSSGGSSGRYSGGYSGTSSSGSGSSGGGFSSGSSN